MQQIGQYFAHKFSSGIYSTEEKAQKPGVSHISMVMEIKASRSLSFPQLWKYKPAINFLRLWK